METHFSLTDIEFEQQFEKGNLNPAIFSHEAHLRLAWIHINKYGEEMAIRNICTQLIQFTKAVDASSKYNHTLTVASVKAVSHFINKSNSNNFKDFISENQRLKSNFIELINTHYKTDIFNSAVAKIKFIEPDLVPFD
jgi:hypothetical protein